MYYVGVDIGGTFTDTVVMDESGNVRTYKTPSTPSDLSLGVMNSLQLAAEDLGDSLERMLSDVVYFGHGTTAATNAFIERRGVKTGLITTKGFGDTILIQRTMGCWAGLGEGVTRYGARSLPSPVVPPDLIREVTERVDYKGEVVVSLNQNEVRQAVRDLVKEGVRAIAVCFLWSFRNPKHEQQVQAVINEEAPDLFVTISSEIAPVIREYERTAATAINSYLGPTIASYIGNLKRSLRTMGFKGTFAMLDSAGGVIRAEEAANKAVLLLNSGPTGGVLASLQLAEGLGYDNMITTDMGGTSFDVSVIVEGRPTISTTREIGKYHIALPMVDITAIGSGGSSIARVENGHLYVGPESAGADPGPACYGKGGTDPTVTDADVVLGIIDPDYFLGGRVKIDRARAEMAIQERIADPLGMTLVEAAAGISAIVDNRMADLLRTLTIGKGFDPRDFVLVAYGGAGPTHTHVYGAECNVRSIIVPATATVHSAYGAVASDMHRSLQMSDLMRTPPFFDIASHYIQAQDLNANFRELQERCTSELAGGAVHLAGITFHRYLDMRYRRQVHEVIVPVPGAELTAQDVDDLVAGFERKYEELYGEGAAFRDAGIEITTFRVQATASLPKPKLRQYELGPADASEALIGERQVHFNEAQGFAATKVYFGPKVQAGAVIAGPAIIEHPGTTIVIGPSQVGRVDGYLNTIIQV